MEPSTIIARCFSLLVGLTLAVSYLLGQEASGRLIEYPFEDQFQQGVPLDLMVDKQGIRWFLTMDELYYILEDGIHKYEGLGDLRISHPEFIDLNDGTVHIISRRNFIRIQSPAHAPYSFDMSSLLTEDEQQIHGAIAQEDEKILLIVGAKEDRDLYIYDTNTLSHRLIKEDVGEVWDILELEDKLMLIGSRLDYLWTNEAKPRLEHIALNDLLKSEPISLELAYEHEGAVFLVNSNGQALKHDLTDASTQVMEFEEPIYDIERSDSGPIALSRSGTLLTERADINEFIDVVNEQLTGKDLSLSFDEGSQVFMLDNQEMWLSTYSGLLQWTGLASRFKRVSTPGTDRANNIHVDEQLDKRWVLSSHSGIWIYRHSTSELLKRIETHHNGEKVAGIKWRLIDRSLYIYSLNGLSELDIDTDELTDLIDPYYIAGQSLTSRLNAMKISHDKETIFIGSKDNHVASLELSTGEERLVSIDQDPDKDEANLIYEIDLLPDGDLLVLSAKDIYHVTVPEFEVTLARDRWKSLPLQEREKRSSIVVAQDSLLVISSFGEGISILNLLRDEYYRPHNDIYALADISDIYWDEEDKVYACSKHGLLSYSLSSNTLSLIDLSSVSEGRSLFYRYMNPKSPGEMYLGMIDSYIYFRSEDLDAVRHWQPCMERYEINGHRQYLSDDAHRSGPVELDYTRNFLSVKMAHPMEDEISQKGMLYRLTGLHDDWRLTTEDGLVRYEALPPGVYTLEVKNAGGEQITAPLKLSILPPFWRTAWFFILTLIILGCIGYWLYTIRMRYVQREAQLLADHQLELAQLEMKSLRAQMNPHFLFNSLNSIKSFIAENEPRTATRYLNKFSHLIRAILNNSREASVSLGEELRSLELFIELEQLRFEGSFDYHITVAADVDTEGTQVPPLLLQPFIENAIWHGLMHKNGERELKIDIQRQGDNLLAKIMDNGIGRAAAEARKSKTATKHKSLGMQITAERIQMAGGKAGKLGVEILDLTSSTGEAMGTEVRIRIPLKDHHDHG